jgi:DNA-binding NarL/FixJ family response regulator
MADDHAIVRGGLRQILALSPDIRVACEAANGAEALQLVRNNKFDLLLLDMTMPGISGVDLIGRIKAERQCLPILVLSMHNESQVVTRAFKAGASGYITKDCEPEKLLHAIRKVADGQKYIDPALAEQIAFDIAFPEQRLPHASLSNREYEILRLLAMGKSINDIARQLVISNKTVSTHKMHLMKKMGLSSMAAIVSYAIQHGLLE